MLSQRLLGAIANWPCLDFRYGAVACQFGQECGAQIDDKGRLLKEVSSLPMHFRPNFASGCRRKHYSRTIGDKISFFALLLVEMSLTL
eukprot:254037-Amphidinium_carterae.1